MVSSLCHGELHLEEPLADCPSPSLSPSLPSPSSSSSLGLRARDELLMTHELRPEVTGVEEEEAIQEDDLLYGIVSGEGAVSSALWVVRELCRLHCEWWGSCAVCIVSGEGAVSSALWVVREQCHLHCEWWGSSVICTVSGEGAVSSARLWHIYNICETIYTGMVSMQYRDTTIYHIPPTPIV